MGSTQQKLYSAQAFRGKPVRVEPHPFNIVRLTCGEGKQTEKSLARLMK
jgi:hypothetical protein